MTQRAAPERRLRLAAVAIACAPALGLAGRFAIEGIGADPIKELTHTTGEWALRFLLVSLAVTPLRRFAGLRRIAPLRRTFGLAAFAYALAHLLVWAILDLGLDPGALVEDVTERPYVMAGMAAFSILAVLAATSTRAAMKRLGPRWPRLHRAVYAAALLALLHYFWLIKADLRPAWAHAAVLAVLLGLRLLWRFRRPAAEVA
ncbi:MAG: protein-methionine-sulfoxide reductase heme-binding subunit MsrQ [Myxococcota bacterium]